MNQKRNSFRMEIHEKIKVKQIFNEKVKSIKELASYEIVKKLGETFEITLLDLSAGGFHGTGNKELNKDDEIQIEIKTSEKEIIEVTGTLMNVDRTYSHEEFFEYRVKFHKLKIREEQLIAKYINSLQSKIMKEKAIEAYDKGETIPISEKIRMDFGERRIKNDFMTKLPPVLSLINWLIIILIIIFIISSRPIARDPISTLMGNKTKHGWDLIILNRAYYLSLSLTIVSFISMIIDLSRQSRREDYKHKSLLIQFSIGLLLMLIFILTLGIGQRGLFK